MDRQDLGMSLGRVPGGVDVQLAERAAQRLLPVEVEGLLAEEEDLVLDQGVVQLLELLVAQGPAEVDAGHLGTDPRCHRGHLDGLVAHVADLPTGCGAGRKGAGPEWDPGILSDRGGENEMS
jgi:hypothetical protein